MRVLLVEDVDQKAEEICAVVVDAIQGVQIERARTVVEGQDAITGGEWGLVVVDISMDIASQSGARMREGHANLGGMDIIEQMYLLGKDAPTVIVTGFDYFVPTDDPHLTQSFAELGRKSSDWLGANFLGSVRYGKAGWEASLRDALNRRPV